MDTEFNEDGRTIELISIALVNEAGIKYYAVSTEFDPTACNEFVRENVLPKLPPPNAHNWRPRAKIAADIRMLMLSEGVSRPEIWGYFADYDWVVFCQLFGRMVDLPKGMPFWCRDLKQLMQDRGIEKSALPGQDAETEHNALADALWVRDAHRFILAKSTTR